MALATVESVGSYGWDDAVVFSVGVYGWEVPDSAALPHIFGRGKISRAAVGEAVKINRHVFSTGKVGTK